MADLYEVDPAFAKQAHCDRDRYRAMYARSLEDPEGFWREQAERITWFKKPTKIKNTSFEGDVSIKWFEDGELNISANCVDRHLASRGTARQRLQVAGYRVDRTKGEMPGDFRARGRKAGLGLVIADVVPDGQLTGGEGIHGVLHGVPGDT